MTLEENRQEQKQEVKLTDKEIFIKIWTSPRLVFKYINDNNYDKFVTVLLILEGIAKTFDRASSLDIGDRTSLYTIIALSIIIGGLVGWISYYLYALMMSWTGKWLKGQGDTKSLLRMTAYAMSPTIITLILLIPQIVIFGNSIFQSKIDILGNGIIGIIIFYTSVVIGLIILVWSVVIFVIGISEIQKLSIGKSILNMLLPSLIILIPIIIVLILR